MTTPKNKPPGLNKTNNDKLRHQLHNSVNGLVTLFSGEAARQGYLAAADQGIISVSNFLATLILARNASPTELGVYVVGFTSLRLLRAFQEGIIIQPLNTYGAAMDHSTFRNYASNTGFIQLMLALASAAGVALLGWVLILLGNDTAGPGIFSLWSVFLWWQLAEFIRRTLYTRGKVTYAVFNSSVGNLFRLGILVVLANQSRLTGATGISAIAVGSLISFVPGMWQTRSYWSIKNIDLRMTWKRNWGFGKWILGSSTANWFAVEFYPVLTAGIISFAAAGAYRALQNIVAPVHVLLKATDTFLTPRAAKLYDQKGIPALSRILRTTYLILGIPIIAMLAIALLFPEFLLELFYGETYLQYSNGIVLMVIFYLLLYLYSPAQTALKAVRIGQPIFIANLIAIAIMLTVGVWLIIQWGVYGTLAGQVVSALIICVILWTAWGLVKRRMDPEIQ
jgi:O-antigen/teichoic acid export membrane protein